MNYRHLGKAGIQVSELSFGSWVTLHTQVGVRETVEMMAAAYDAGVNFFDNAEAYAGGDSSVADTLKEMVGSIGENMTLRRTAHLAADNGVVASYMHNQAAPGLGKIGVIVALDSAGDAEAVKGFGKQVAMHIAATNPQAIDTDSLDQELVERERTVLTEQAKESGKPDNVIEKMVEGRLRKFYEEVVLLKQPFVHDPDNTVAKAMEAAGKDAGAPIKIVGFYRFALGEGIEKEESDFAAEVAAAASGA